MAGLRRREILRLGSLVAVGSFCKRSHRAESAAFHPQGKTMTIELVSEFLMRRCQGAPRLRSAGPQIGPHAARFGNKSIVIVFSLRVESC